MGRILDETERLSVEIGRISGEEMVRLSCRELVELLGLDLAKDLGLDLELWLLKI